MNTTTLKGEAQNVGGSLKEAGGTLTGDQSLKSDGIGDQISGTVNKGIGAVQDAIAGRGDMVGQARQFARDKPWATAALAGVVGLAVINTLRGK